MPAFVPPSFARRDMLAGAALIGLLALPGCASMERRGYINAVERLLRHASENAFARLTAPDGFWNSAVARIELPVLFGRRGGVLQGILTSEPFRERLQRRLNTFAEEGAERAAPVVADAVRAIGRENAMALLRGGPTEATSFLRQRMGPALVNAMIPALEDAMRVANDPLIGQAIMLLAGVDLGDVAHALALSADNAIWYEIGNAESEIRANPETTGDRELIAALRMR